MQRKQDEYRQTGQSPSAIDLHRELNALKQTAVPWMYAVSKCAPQEALRNLDRAFAHFFRRVQLKKAGKYQGKLGYPERKSKKRGLSSFRLTGSISVYPDAVHLPRLGRLRLKERGYLPTGTVKLLGYGHGASGALVRLRASRARAGSAREHGPVVGVDLGVKQLATLSDGTTAPNPRHLKSCLKKLKRAQRIVSRRRKGSRNRRKATQRLARLHRTVANRRTNTLHHLTSRLAKTKSVVVMEDLNVAGMLKNHQLAQALSDVGFAEFRRQLAYKAEWYGCRIIVADRWFASSKTCSRCGWVDEQLTLADRTFRCQHCGLVMDRDLNAAKNLEKLADSSADSQNACGGE
ncbi:MAG TPA: RNA-guided endonuclease TnpB family protein, partial [Ktedonobacterales bacterium]|nr:RNA-guided endonuclease TnpB family protein [Ktedonobacterales bacterium]